MSSLNFSSLFRRVFPQNSSKKSNKSSIPWIFSNTFVSIDSTVFWRKSSDYFFSYSYFYSFFSGSKQDKYDFINMFVVLAFFNLSWRIFINLSFTAPLMHKFFSLSHFFTVLVSPWMSAGIMTFSHPRRLKYLIDSDSPSAVTITLTFLGKYLGSQKAILPSFPLFLSKK